MLSSSLRWKKKGKVSAKQAIILLSLVLVALLPIAFQKEHSVKQRSSHRTLTIITSHNETIRREFATAFSKYWFRKTQGEVIYINWVTPGGSSEVRRVIDTKFSNFEKHQGEEDVENVGLDLYFGGGVHEFDRAKSQGYLARLNIFKDKPQLFLAAADTDNANTYVPEEAKGASIPQTHKGETFYDKDHQWLGACISSFGIVFNKDTLNRLGYTEDEYPKTWDDLTNPRLFKNIALADPTKSGSVTKVFELIIQQKMQKHIKENPNPLPAESKERHRQRLLNEGWEKGLKLVQKICANARYFSDSATKIPHDVANGDAAVGMCIDFYGRTYNSKHQQADGTSRVEFRTPIGGSSLSADPIAVFKHAAEPELAQAFVEFVMSDDGQMLWNGDPKKAREYTQLPRLNALRRLPINKDIYLHKDYVTFFTDPDEMPYSNKESLHYDSELTGKTFNALQTIIRVMAIDTHEELADAWVAILESNKKLDAQPKNIELRQRYLEILDQHFHGLSKVSYTKTIADFSAKISKMKRKRQLNTRLKILEQLDFAEEKMAQFYPNLDPQDYPKAIKLLEQEVKQLKSFDIMTLELQQQDLASQFRASYAKAIKNADKL